MTRLRRFRRLSWGERFLFLQSLLLLAWVTGMLRLLPFPLVRRLLLQSDADIAPDAPQPLVKQIVWSVRSASRFVPAATCLPQALVAQRLLTKRNYAATLRIGVAKNGMQQLTAHAWVESGGKVIIGGTDSSRRYVALPPLEKERA